MGAKLKFRVLSQHICLFLLSHSARSAWIEIRARDHLREGPRSHSARSAWIEIFIDVDGDISVKVALREECVD